MELATEFSEACRRGDLSDKLLLASMDYSHIFVLDEKVIVQEIQVVSEDVRTLQISRSKFPHLIKQYCKEGRWDKFNPTSRVYVHDFIDWCLG